ncbi:MAG: multifunctional CCA addition/repair protein [Burkholderiaceae bacterium]
MVGGAVRDHLLGLPVKDRDFVVVGATPQQMLAQGFTPVGKDFPVFLHPQTHEEHALARTERKTGPGYKGFVVHTARDITLEQDLARRDLTINAMAQAEDGSVIDPFGGQIDLQARILRHVSPAFQEDPVRILRLARFAARFTDFSVAPETAFLMRTMVRDGEVDALVPERIWQEFSRGLMEVRPSRMVCVLRECGALARLLPALAALWTQRASSALCSTVDTEDATLATLKTAGSDDITLTVATAIDSTAGDTTLRHLDAAAQVATPLPVRLALLLEATARLGSDGAGNTTPIEAACRRLKIPGSCRDLAIIVGRERDALLAGPGDPQLVLALLERCDAFRKPMRFQQVLDTLRFVAPSDASAPILAQWHLLLEAAQRVDAGAIATNARRDFPDQPMRINQAVREARNAAVAQGMDALGRRQDT